MKKITNIVNVFVLSFSILFLGSFALNLISPSVASATILEDKCVYDCPTIHYEWTEKVYQDCPEGYSAHQADKCKKNDEPGKNTTINRGYSDIPYSADVAYTKSGDQNKCHRPSDSTLDNTYGMDHETIGKFKNSNDEWLNFDVSAPEGYYLENGVCLPNPVDLCLNEETDPGIQTTTPCNSDDVCPEISGIQTNTELCPAPIDMCPDVPGDQSDTTLCPPAETPQCNIVSDTTNVVEEGINSYDAVETWNHSSWYNETILGSAVKWIWKTFKIETPLVNETQVFVKKFDLNQTPVTATIIVAADNGFKLEINGIEIANKLAVENNFTGTVSYPVTNLIDGENIIRMTVTNFAQAGGTPESNPAGALYKLHIEGGLCSDINPIDVCTNIEGYQSEAPEGMVSNEGICAEAPKISKVTMCKIDTQENPLSGWTLMLKGEDAQTGLSVPANLSTGVNSNSLLGGVSYIAKAVGTWLNQGGANPADAEYSTTDAWVNQMDGYTGYQNDILELQINNQFDPISNWGSYNSAHTYAQSFVPSVAGPANFRIFDGTGTAQNEGWFGDNSGNLIVDISEGYSGITGENGCTTFSEVPYGTYTTDEIMKDGWENTSGLDEVVIDEPTETFTIVNKDILPPSLTFKGFRDQSSGTYDDTQTINSCGSVNSSGYIAWEWQLNPGEINPVSYTYTITSGPTAVGWTTTTSSTHHNGGIPMQGTYEVSVTGTDEAGNVSAPISCSVTYSIPPTPTCSDGIQNQNETGVDTGGVCTVIDDTDTDDDGITDPNDNCPFIANSDQADADMDLVGDACDNCVVNSNPDQADSNDNGVGDVCEQAPVIYACSDGIDNDGDGSIDSSDLGCTSENDNDETNIVEDGDSCPNVLGKQTETPCADTLCLTPNTWDTETQACIPPTTPQEDMCPNIADIQETIPAGKIKDNEGNCVTPATSRRGGSIGGSILGAAVGEVLGESTSCGIYIEKYLRKGIKNNADTVKKLQKFLNDYMSAGLKEDGVFGTKTETEVKKFQSKHADKILTPWNLKEPTGIFYLTTQTEVNNIMCPALKLPIPELVPLTDSVFN